MRKIPQPQNPNPMDLRVQRRHKKREGKVERDTARVFYMRLSPVRLKIQFNSEKEFFFLLLHSHRADLGPGVRARAKHKIPALELREPA